MERKRVLAPEVSAVLEKLPIDETIYGMSDFPKGIINTDCFYYQRFRPIEIYGSVRAMEQHVEELRKSGIDPSFLFKDKKQLSLRFGGVTLDVDSDGSLCMYHIGGRANPEAVRFVESLMNDPVFLEIAKNMISERFKKERS